jgi:hypothetical protein
MVNSPQTELASAITDTDTTIPLLDASKLPPAPNLATIGTGEDAETILYTGVSGNDLTGVTRGFQGSAKAWVQGTKVARYITAYDHDTFRGNIADHETRLTGAESTLSAATSTVTPNTLVQRDANGRFKAAAPAASDDVARKAETDAALSAAQAAQNTANAALPKSGGEMTGDQVFNNAKGIYSRDTGGNIRRVALLSDAMRIGDGNVPLRFHSSGKPLLNDSEEFITSAGGQTIYGTLIFANNIPIRLSETGGTTRNAIFMSGVNDIMVGSTANPLIFSASSVPKYYDGSIAHDIWSAANAGPFYRGSGSPEGVVTAPVGAIYQRTDGGASTTLYVKESGTGNTGWKAVQTA